MNNAICISISDHTWKMAILKQVLCTCKLRFLFDSFSNTNTFPLTRREESLWCFENTIGLTKKTFVPKEDEVNGSVR